MQSAQSCHQPLTASGDGAQLGAGQLGLQLQPLRRAVAEKCLLVARPIAHRPRRCAISWPICVMPLRETTIGTPICADLITISLVRRPVV